MTASHRFAADPTDVVPSEVRASTPTATAVYFVLRETPPLTYDELADATGMSRRAVETAVLDLRERGVVASAPNLQNPNESVHDLDNVD